MHDINDMMNFILDKSPTGVIVIDPKMEIVFCNRQAGKFLKKHNPPEEISILCRRIFNSLGTPGLKNLFPGEIYLHKKLEGSSSNWTFTFHICEGPHPFVCIFVIEESVSNKIDLNKIRNRFRLTRRETDVLRRVLNGLKNIEIAEDLNLSEQTIKDHLSNVYMKINVKNRFELLNSLLNSPDRIPL